jgi:hypothetical protein
VNPDENDDDMATYTLFPAVVISHAPLGEKVSPVGKRVFPMGCISTGFVVPSAVLRETRRTTALTSIVEYFY